MHIPLFPLLTMSLAFATNAVSAATVTVSSLADLARVAAADNQSVRMQPGVYPLAEYLTPEVLAAIHAERRGKPGRPPVPMFVFTGSGNSFEFSDVTFEIDNSLYAKLPGGYVRCLIVRGAGNTLSGLTIRHVGPNTGSGGNTLSLEGERTVLEDATLHVYGSFPYGYGDLLGKGGPNLVGIRKQSGVQILGSGSVVRRSRVYSRAFGHCFYVQYGGDIVLEDCYAEGVMRATDDMLRDTSGPAFDLGFPSVYENRDGRYLMVSGYMKSLVEDGFRTYGNAGRVTLRNCTAVNTRAGFEIGARDDAPQKTQLDNCVAVGCERGFLIGSQTIVRRSRGDLTHGPLLYLRGGRESDVELELVGPGPRSLVHAVATLAGQDHRVHLSARPGDGPFPALPIMLGFGMPDHAEMASPIRPAPATRITLVNEIAALPVISSETLTDTHIETAGRSLSDTRLRASPGSWGPATPAPAPGTTR